MSNIVIEYRILLSNSEFRMPQRFRVDRDIFENSPRVDADLFLYGYKKMHFQKDPDTCGRGLSLSNLPFQEFRSQSNTNSESTESTIFRIGINKTQH